MHLLLDDPWIVAVNKPSGLFTQAAPGVPSLQQELIERFRVDAASPPPFVGIVHRLDRPTSGVVVYGRTAAAVKQLNHQFRERTVRKRYLAIVRGEVAPAGEADDWMRKVEDVARAELCRPEDAEARRALLRWTRLASDGTHSLVEVHLETGRMHQIRLQFASRGHAVVGDPLYGQAFEGGPADPFGLHAWKLSLRHPKTAKLLELTAPLPDAWRERFPELLSPIST